MNLLLLVLLCSTFDFVPADPPEKYTEQRIEKKRKRIERALVFRVDESRDRAEAVKKLRLAAEKAGEKKLEADFLKREQKLKLDPERVIDEGRMYVNGKHVDKRSPAWVMLDGRPCDQSWSGELPVTVTLRRRPFLFEKFRLLVRPGSHHEPVRYSIILSYKGVPVALAEGGKAAIGYHHGNGKLKWVEFASTPTLVDKLELVCTKSRSKHIVIHEMEILGVKLWAKTKRTRQK